jgi:hypothetical protein
MVMECIKIGQLGSRPRLETKTIANGNKIAHQPGSALSAEHET